MRLGGSAQLVQRCSVLTDDPASNGDALPPLHAVKVATAVVRANGRLRFIPKMASYRSYGPRVAARCARHRHAAPDAECSCGFYAGRDLRALGRLVHVPYPNTAILTVELGGTCIEGTLGVRGAEQLVRAVWVANTCSTCARPATGVTLGPPAAKGTPLVGACHEHLGEAPVAAGDDPLSRLGDVRVGVLPADAAALLPQRWLRALNPALPMAADHPRPSTPRRRDAPHTATALRVGQRAYLEPAALVVGPDGSASIDGDAYVSPTPTASHTVQVQRRTGDRFSILDPSSAARPGGTAVLATTPSASTPPLRSDPLPSAALQRSAAPTERSARGLRRAG